MKKTIIASLFAATVVAAPVTAAPNTCANVQTLAETIMDLRQDGARMADVMRVAGSTDNPAATKMARIFVQAAYAKPRWHSDQLQQETIRDFGNAAFALCYAATH